MGEAWTTLTRCPQAHSHNSNRQVLSRDGTKDRRRQRFQLRKPTRWSRRSGPLHVLVHAGDSAGSGLQAADVRALRDTPAGNAETERLLDSVQRVVRDRIGKHATDTIRGPEGDRNGPTTRRP